LTRVHLERHFQRLKGKSRKRKLSERIFFCSGDEENALIEKDRKIEREKERKREREKERKREGEKERKREREKEREKKRERVCVCERVREKEREKKKDSVNRIVIEAETEKGMEETNTKSDFN
jgi:hypothetical protein